MRSKTMLLGASLLLSVGVGTASQAATLYSNDFSSNTNGFSGATTIATTPTGEKYLTLYNGGSNPATGQTTLSIAPGATNLNLSFNVYAIQSVDGNGPFGGGPDPFQILIDGIQAYNVNFANFGGDTQSYSGNLATSGPGFSYADQTGATAVGTLGYGTGSFGDSTYLLSFALPTLTTSVTFIGATNEDLGNENYGIDNVVVTGMAAAVIGAVPEPASWLMLITGFGMIGAGLRSRRRRTVLRYA